MALYQLEQNYGTDQFIHIDWHVIQSFNNPAADERDAHYGGIPATPSVFFDGQDNIVGGGQNMYPVYEPEVIESLAEQSKIILDAHAFFDNATRIGNVTVDLEIAPGESFPSAANKWIRVFLCEDVNVGTLYHNIGRQSLPQTALTAQNSGDTQNVVHAGFSFDSEIADISNLKAMVVVENDNSNRILQARLASWSYDVEVAHIDAPTQKVVGASGDGGGTATAETQITYTGVVSDDVVITLDKTNLPAGWDADVTWNATTDPNSITISSMTPDQNEFITIRTIPNDTPGVGTVGVTISPATDPGRAYVRDYHTFNRTTAVLYVDDDNGSGYEAMFEDAIIDAGHFSVTHTLSALGMPDVATLAAYDVVVWNTADLQIRTIGAGGQQNIIDFLESGTIAEPKGFFLTSQGILNHQGLVPLVSDYLQVASFSQEAQAPSATGVPGDPVGDGLNLTLTPPFPDFADAITPNTLGTIWLNGANGDIGVRYDAGHFKTVFMSAGFEGISQIAPDPNNQATVMDRIIDWFAPSGVTDAPDVAAGPNSVALWQNAPNPFQAKTSVRFAIPKEGLVSLSVYNVAGQKVADLAHRNFTAGEHTVSWNGLDASGARVASGVYLYRLETAGQSVTKEMVLMK